MSGMYPVKSTGRPPLPKTLAGLHRCSHCKADKPKEEFYKDASKPDGYGYRCKACNTESKKAYNSSHHAKNRERYNARRRERYWANRDQELATQAESKKKNGLKWAANSRKKRLADPVPNMLANAKRRASVRGLEFTITRDDVVMPTHCPVLGIPLVIGNIKTQPNSPSLDRIDNTKGYVPGNVVIVSMRANTIKSDATVEELRAVADFYQKLL